MQVSKYAATVERAYYELERWAFHQQRAHKHPAIMSPARRRKLRKD